MAIEVSSGSAARRGVRACVALSAGYAALALIPVVALFVLTALSPPMALNDYLSDDAYYYLRVASNIADGVGSTYGGLVPTNGYHPLWQLALVPVFWLIRTPDQAIPAVFAIASAAWIASVALYRRIGQMCDAEAPFLLGGLYLAWLCTYALPGGAGLEFLGMETTLALPAGPVAGRVEPAPCDLHRCDTAAAHALGRRRGADALLSRTARWRVHRRRVYPCVGDNAAAARPDTGAARASSWACRSASR